MALPPPIALRLTTLPSHDCNYLPGRLATTRAFRTDHIPGAMYHQLMDSGFRRSGTIIYQPVCDDCQSCIPIRIPVDRFVPSKSQRRAVRANADLSITVSTPVLTDEKLDLYQRYLAGWHGKEGHEQKESLEEFLYQSPVRTIEFCYRTPEQKLIGVGICDVCETSLSSVYFYFDPDHRHRSLGTFSALHEIDWCRDTRIPYLYLGYWVNGCGSMQYKSQFRPAEILNPEGGWEELPHGPQV